MPYLALPGGGKLYYALDDHTDAWRPAETVIFVHGYAETSEAWRGWVPHFSAITNWVPHFSRSLREVGPFECAGFFSHHMH